MSEELVSVLTALVGALTEHKSGEACSGCCACTTVREFEATAVRSNDQSAFATSESQKNFVQQQAAQFSHLLQLQQDCRVKPAT